MAVMAARALARAKFFRRRSQQSYFRPGWYRTLRWRIRVSDLLPDDDDLDDHDPDNQDFEY